MERDNLILYDNNGMIVNQTGQARGNLKPHKIPEGINYILDPYDAIHNYRVLSVDVSTIPHSLNKILIHEKTEEELALELNEQLSYNKQEAYNEYVELEKMLGAESPEAIAAKEAYVAITAESPGMCRYELETELAEVPSKIQEAKQIAVDAYTLELIESGVL